MKKEWRTIKKNKTLGAFKVSQEVGPGRSAQAGQIQAQSGAIQEAGLESGPKVWLQVKRMVWRPRPEVKPEVELRNPAGGSHTCEYLAF